MAGVGSAAVLIAAFIAVTGCCVLLTVRLYRSGSSGRPRPPEDTRD